MAQDLPKNLDLTQGELLPASQIEVHCADFRSRFQAAPEGAIEVILQRVPESAYLQLLPELIAEEVQMRQAAGSQPNAADYKRRFPKHAEAVLRGWQLAKESNSQGNRSSTNVSLPSAFDTDRPPASTKSSEPIPDPTFPGFEVLGRLGIGGFGVVYKVVRQGDSQPLAIKMLLPERAEDPSSGPQMCAQFIAEASMMQLFDHPNIVRMIEINEAAVPPYFVQEFIDGSTLDDWLKAKQKLPQFMAIEFAI